MALFSSLVPGLREVRAPLISGYLWLLCAWLLFEPAVPSPQDNEIYERLVAVGEIVGPLGLAVTASVAAYLIGSLIQSAVRWGWRQMTRDLGPLRFDEEQHELFDDLASSDKPLDIGIILKVADPFHEVSLGRPFLSDTSMASSVWEIADRELIESFRQLQLVVRAIQRRVRASAVCSFGMHARTPVVQLNMPASEGLAQVEYVIPHLLPSRDILGQVSLLQTRLIEEAEATGAQIERLHAEADFRFTIAPSLCALALILAVGASPLWLISLVVPAALIAQGVAFFQQGLEEILDALRARTQTPELERITPVFERYRTFATKLAEGLEVARWKNS